MSSVSPSSGLLLALETANEKNKSSKNTKMTKMKQPVETNKKKSQEQSMSLLPHRISKKSKNDLG